MKFKEIKPGMVIHCPKEEDKIALSQYLMTRDDLDFIYTDPKDEVGYFFYVSDIDGGPNDVMDDEITEFSDLIEPEPRFKVGDKVRVRNDLEPNGIYGGVNATSEMSKHAGEEMTIFGVIGSAGKYILQEASHMWTDEMLEPVNDSPINSPTDSPMTAEKLLEWFRQNKDTGIIYDLFSVEIEELFDFATNDEIIRIITAYEAAKKAPKPVEVEEGWHVEVYEENGDLWNGDYFYLGYTKDDVESIAKRVAMDCVRQTGKSATWSVIDACRVKE